MSESFYCKCNDGEIYGLISIVGSDSATTYSCEYGSTGLAVSTATPPPPTTTTATKTTTSSSYATGTCTVDITYRQDSVDNVLYLNLTSEIKDADGNGIGSNKTHIDKSEKFFTDSELPEVMIVTFESDEALNFAYASQSWNQDDEKRCTSPQWEDTWSNAETYYSVNCTFQCPGT